MSSTILTLNIHGKQILLIGTVHISSESVDEVRMAIRDNKPECVCVEIKQVLIDERDRFLATKIFQAPGFWIVAVVGAGHWGGVWNTPCLVLFFASLGGAIGNIIFLPIMGSIVLFAGVS